MNAWRIESTQGVTANASTADDVKAVGGLRDAQSRPRDGRETFWPRSCTTNVAFGSPRRSPEAAKT
jgi:hypothetical protein